MQETEKWGRAERGEGDAAAASAEKTLTVQIGVESDCSFARGCQIDLRRAVWILCWEMHIEQKESVLIGGALRAGNEQLSVLHTATVDTEPDRGRRVDRQGGRHVCILDRQASRECTGDRSGSQGAILLLLIFVTVERFHLAETEGRECKSVGRGSGGEIQGSRLGSGSRG